MQNSYFRWFVLIVFFATSCNKNQDNTTTTNQTTGDSTPVKIEGTIFWLSSAKMRLLDLQTNKYTESPTLRFYDNNNPYTPLCYDSGSVYTGNPYGATRLDAGTGAIKWELQYSSFSYSNSSLSHKSSCVVSNNLVYIAGFTGSLGVHCLYAIDKLTGVIKWQKSTTGWGDFSSLPTPVINGDQIIVAANNYSDNGLGLNRLICLNKTTGNVIWDKSYSYQLGSWLVTKNNVLYVKTLYPEGILAVNPNTGEQNWMTQVAVGNFDDKLLCADNALVAHGGTNGSNISYYYYLNYNTGQVQGSITTDPFFSWVNADVNYIANTGRYIIGYDKTNNKQIWKTEREDNLIADTASGAQSSGATNLLHYKNYVLQYAVWINKNLPGPNNRILSTIYVFDINTGKLVQRIPIGNDIPGSFPAFDFILVNQNKPNYTHYSGNVPG